MNDYLKVKEKLLTKDFLENHNVEFQDSRSMIDFINMGVSIEILPHKITVERYHVFEETGYEKEYEEIFYSVQCMENIIGIITGHIGED